MSRLTRVSVSLFAALFAASASGETTFDLSAIAQAGDGAEGWELHAITNYASNRQAMRFSAADSFAVSPIFPEPIVAVSLVCLSSSATRRRLTVTPLSSAGQPLAETLPLAYSPSKSTFTNQTLRWSAALDVRRIRLAYDDGATTVWGVLEATVYTASSPPDEPPEPIPRADSALSLRAHLHGETVRFSPDFAALSAIDGKTPVDGVVPGFGCLIFREGVPETAVRVNAGSTQYQGHYVWVTNDVVSGFGTYTATGAERTFGWLLENDTGGELVVESLDVVYGQWGARNTLADGLTFAWKVAAGPIAPSDPAGWQTRAEDAFAAPFRVGDSGAVFPAFETRTLQVAPRIPRGGMLAIRFADTCPSGGNNAHLGIAGLTLVARRLPTRGFAFTVR